MKKLVLMAAFAAFASATVAAAQDPGMPPGARGRGPGGRGPGGPGGPMMMDRMLLRGITLSDAQRAQLKALHDGEQQKMEAERANGQGRQEMDAMRAAREKGDTVTVRQLMNAQRAKMDARRDEQIASIRAILTGDQVTAFDANVAEMKQRGAEGRGRGRGPRPPHG